MTIRYKYTSEDAPSPQYKESIKRFKKDWGLDLAEFCGPYEFRVSPPGWIEVEVIGDFFVVQHWNSDIEGRHTWMERTLGVVPRVPMLKVTKTVVLTRRGTDLVHFDLDAPTPFPELGHDACARVETQKGHGVEWASAVGAKTIKVLDT